MAEVHLKAVLELVAGYNQLVSQWQKFKNEGIQERSKESFIRFTKQLIKTQAAVEEFLGIELGFALPTDVALNAASRPLTDEELLLILGFPMLKETEVV